MIESQNENPEHLKLEVVKGVFNRLYSEAENTLLETGAKEPFYKAATASVKARIYSRENFLSSALHEIAHWTIAGSDRRQKDDFGYWYEEDGRNVEQQEAFEKAEVKPQAIEWLFSLACNHSFHYSADNLSEQAEATASFKSSVKQQTNKYIISGLPPRAQFLLDEFISVFRAGHYVQVSELETQNA